MRKRLILDLLSFSERPCPSLSLCVILQGDVWVLLGRARVEEGCVLAAFWSHVLFYCSNSKLFSAGCTFMVGSTRRWGYQTVQKTARSSFDYG